MLQHTSQLHGWITSYCVCVPHFSYPFTHWWMYGLSLPFGYRDYYCNEHWHTIICIPVFSSFGYTEKVYLRVELLGHTEILCLVFGFSAKLFSRVCTILHFHLKCTRILIFPNPRWHLLIYYYYQYHLCRHELVPHWGTDTHFPNDLWCWTFFHVFIAILKSFSVKCFFIFFAHFLFGMAWDFCLLVYW